ncbi:MAG: Gfo/Idh/MocA family oxidoreductase, partial [Bacteroidia bacterium]|nr:Gfo/Idh/MocA family oxidoreductase [Bacteroidia bacterium]
MEKRIRWGILGLGNIARKFALDLALIPQAELVAVASRNAEKAKDFTGAIPQNPQFLHGSYEDLFANTDVEIIYIATPHHAHKKWAIEAMKNGKHVLCEKPMGINKGEVSEMIACAKENNVFLMEGLWSRFNPALLKMKAMIAAGTIGKVGYIQADFAFNAMDRPLDSRIWNPDLAGGSLLDIGIYPIFLSYWLLGMPKDIKAVADFHPLGVDQQ